MASTSMSDDDSWHFPDRPINGEACDLPSDPAPPPLDPDPPSASDVALRTHDVLSNVFQHIACDRLSDVEDEEYTARRNLLIVAQTCKGFLGPALDSLWEVIPSLVPLLSLLPSFRKVNNKFVLGDVGPTDWGRFDLHARRVRTILMRKPHPAVSPYVYLRLPHHRTSDLLPGLKDVRVTQTSTHYHDPIDLSGLFPVLTPNIRVVELNETAVQDTEFFGAFLSATGARTPHLRHLILRGTAIVDNQPELNSILNLKGLETMEILLPNATLPLHWIEGLGSLEYLHSLTIDVGSRPANGRPNPGGRGRGRGRVRGSQRLEVPMAGLSFLRFRPPISFPPLFEPLRKLHLIGNLASLARTIGYMNLKSLTIVALEDRQTELLESAASLWVNIFGHLSSTAANSLTVMRIIQPVDAYGEHRLSGTLLIPIFQIQNLEVLDINASAFSCDDGELTRMLSAFSKLKILHLPPSYYSSAPTLRALFRPLDICQGLEELSICVNDSHNYADIEIPRKDGHRALRKLRVSSSFGQLTDTQVIQLARLFDRAFPNLEIIEGYTRDGYGNGTADNESWKRVQEFRLAVQEVRREFE